jgi:ABC-2 type transport system permease protein
MKAQMISTLVIKDLSLYFRNQFFALVTILGVVAYAVMYYLLPSTVDETLEVGFFAPVLPPEFVEPFEEAGIILKTAESEEALKTAIDEGDYNVGVVISDELLAKLAAGEKDDITIYFGADFPDEQKQANVIIFQELAFNLVGQSLHVDANEEILGVDLAGAQIPIRERMLPMLAVFILMVETMGLAALITAEIEGRTIGALLITPLTTGGLFTSKAIMGTGFSFAQATLLMLVTGGLNRQPVLILTSLLIGAGLVTAIGFLMASAAKDMMSVMGWGVLAIIILALPAFNVLLPGLASEWIKIIPSYYLVDTVFRVINFDAGWSDVTSNLLILLLSTGVFFALGMFVLRRKFR